ncbi:MAG: segregation and condensation protein A [Chloroflexia bacterium]
MVTGYVVETQVFRGPLDLLLYLIEKEELDITQIALAQVTNQFLAYLSRLPRRDPAELSAFLWVAARLLWIKSRVLLPRPPLAVEEVEEDVGEDLVRRLQEYRRYRRAAAFLEERLKAGWRTWGRVAPTALPSPRPAELEGVSLEALLVALQRRLAELAAEEEERPRPPSARVTLVEKARLIHERLYACPEVSFQELLAEASSREEVVVTFWAVLELFKRGWILIEQEELFGPIRIRRRSDTASAWEGHPEWWSELEDLA